MDSMRFTLRDTAYPAQHTGMPDGGITTDHLLTFPSWARDRNLLSRRAYSWPNFSIASGGRNAPIIPAFEEITYLDPTAMSVVIGSAESDRNELARQVIRMGPRRHHVGYFASRLNNGLVTYESSLEHDACLIFEADPEIRAYRAQPVQLSLHYMGRTESVYPDFELVLDDGSLVYLDVKPHEKAQSPRFQARMNALIDYTSARGMGYSLITDIQQRRLPLPAIRTLLSTSRGRVKNIVAQTTWAWLKGISPQPDLQYVLGRLGRYPAVCSAIAGWILDGDIRVDFFSEALRDQLLDLAPKQSGRVRHV